MAASDGKSQFNPQTYLSPNQHDLLLAALSSNNVNGKGTPPNGVGRQSSGTPQQQQFMNTMNNGFYASPQQTNGLSDINGLNGFDVDVDDSPFLDMLDGDANFDFDNINTGDLMIGSLPGDTSQSGETSNGSPDDGPDKRKSPGDEEPEAEGGAKRQEGDDKTAKKPGRKPLTSEPTTKRKAQNRAAQRAFRERKEKHLKDLETKVVELEKASESTNHENGLLRAQVDRLQTELREYRKRLSLNSSGIRNSTPGLPLYQSVALGGTTANNFHFEFPRFGNLPGSHIFNNGSLGRENSQNKSPPPAAGVLTRSDSNGRVSPKNLGNGTANQHSPSMSNDSNKTPPATTQNMKNGTNGTTTIDSQNLAGMFTPSFFNGMGTDYAFSGTEGKTNGSAASANGGRIFQFNSGSSASNTDSPSTSSNSQYGNSSCATSPEPSHNSPGNGNRVDTLDTVNEQGYVCHGNSEGEVTFCEKLNMACGNPRNPVPRAISQSNGTPAPAAAKTNPATDVNGIDWLANQNGGQFDPVLFGDYRESQAAVVGDGDFTGGFFNEAFPLGADFGSPFNIVPSPAPPQKNNLMEDVERAQEGDDDDEVVPGEDPSQMLSCHKIWDKIQDRPDFKEGNFDIDGLCSELRAKARCSESGVVVDQKDVDAALKRLPLKQGS